MSSKLSTFCLAALASIFLVIFSNSCKGKKEAPSKAQDFAEYISAYSSGVLSRESEIRVVLTKAIEVFPGVGEPAKKGLLTFDPQMEGELTWEDQNTLRFSPSDYLPDGENYQASLDLDAIYKDVSSELATFKFNFQVVTQVFEISNLNLRTYNAENLGYNKIEGTILSADFASESELSELLFASQNGQELTISWQTDLTRKHHHFVIDSVIRTEKAGAVNFKWGEKVGEGFKMETFQIPALGDFKVLGINVIQSPEQEIVINFSDPLLEDQNINGLVEIEDSRQPSYIIKDTELHLFVKGTISGEHNIIVHPGIKNVAGYALQDAFEQKAHFADLKPAVELIGKGSILPSTANLALPFKAVNLKAVDVFVLKIYADNVPQFLQTNRLEGSYQLKRVGRPIAYKRIDLVGAASDLKKWNNYSIDLASFIKPEPGAIYRVELKFKRPYSLYKCDDAPAEEDMMTIEADELNTAEYDNPNQYYWDDYYYDDYYYYGDYNYRERDNPCNLAYYSSNRDVARNVLATDLALTVKGGDKEKFTAFVTDIKTALPISGATVQLLNYQQQVMKESITQSDGSITLDLKGKPFLAVAKYKGQRAYLRIDDGSSLSLSNFEIAGSKVKKGLKGFIYAERGVWRPGDSIHATFILEDRENTLPDAHPVIFEVRNPEGKLVDRQVKSTHISRIYTFPFATEQSAPTGFYSCQVRVGGSTFNKSLRIETIKPNRLKINLTFDNEILSGANVDGHLHANWLTGAKARNLKADINMQIKNVYQPFEKFKDFDFKDDTRQFHTSDVEVFKGEIDENGDVDANLKMGSYDLAPGMLQAVFITRVFEQGGEFSIDRQSFNYAPFSHFVGIKTERPASTPWLTTDKPITINVVTTDVQGQLVNRNVTAQVYAIDWSWWWSSGRNGYANYLNSSYVRSIKNTQFETDGGKGKFDFEVNYPNYGNYLIRVCDEESGHCTSQIVYVDWPMSRDRGGRSNPGAPTMLTFTADKDNYNVGDVAHLTIPTSESGRLLVSIETGSELLKHMWIDAEKGQTEIDVEITEKMTPNVYAFVSYIQPHSKTVNDLPIRLYGVIPINVNNKNTRLEPVIETVAEWKPESSAYVQVSEKSGKPMTYTIAIVGEGLLDITRFRTPDPWSHFYAKEALGMRTWDYFDHVIGAFGGVIEKNFAIGGDQEIDPAGKKRLNRFKPLVKVMGPFKLQAGEKEKHVFKMPNYIGSARVMLVARNEEAYGNAEKTVPVRKPLMVLATLPRVLGPGEKVRLPVQVFAMKENIKNVTVTVKAGKLFNVVDGNQKIVFDEVGDKMVFFDLDTKNMAGEGTIEITVKSGNETASYNVAVKVRNPNAVESKKQSVIIPPGESYKFSLEAFGMDGSNKVTLEAALIPDLNISDALGYLMRYPHGCIEQTVSAAFSQLFVNEFVDLTEGQKTLAKENIMYAIKKLQANQTSAGAFTTWPSSSRINNWSTSYAGHFIIEAENKGYTVPSDLKSKWLNYEKRAASNWRYSHDRQWRLLEQSYRLYVLAVAGEPDIGAMNRLRNYFLTKSAGWRLAAAYIVAGQKDAALELMNKTYVNYPRNYYDPTFGNELRASAMRLENYLLLEDDTKSFEQALILAKQLNEKSLYTTQSTAYALMTMTNFLKGKQSAPLKLALKASDLSEEVNQMKPIYRYAFGEFEKDISITNRGNENLYVSVIQDGQPLPGKEQSIQNGIITRMSFQTLDGVELDPQAIQQGTDFRAIVTISTSADPYKLHDMALTQVFPSGWEIMNNRLLELEDLSGQSYAQYKDIRDDRVYTYFDIYDHKSRTYEVKLNAAYLGDFYLPGVKVESMYFPEVISHSAGRWVKVVAPQ